MAFPRLSFNQFIVTVLFLLTGNVYQANQGLNVDSIRNELTKMKEDTVKVNFLEKISAPHREDIPVNVMLEFQKQALQIELKFEFKRRQAFVYRQLGNVYFQRLNNYEKALENYFIALKITESIDDKGESANCLNNIGNVYTQRAGITGNRYDYKQALNYHNQALSIREKYWPNNVLLANSYLNTGNLYTIIGEYEKASEALKKCLAIYLRNKDTNGIALSYMSFGELNIKKGDYDEALNYYSKCLEYLENTIDKTKECTIYNSIGIIYLKKKQFDLSLEYFNKALTIAEELNLKDELTSGYNYISQVYNLKHDYKSALKYLQMYSQLKDTLLNIESTRNITRIQSIYETEKKEKEILSLKQEKEIQELNLNQQQLKLNQRQSQIIALVSVLLFVVLLVIFLLNRTRVKQKELFSRQRIKQQELLSKAIIEAEQKERQRIARDLHDGIGQLLSAAKLNISSLENAIHIDSKEEKQLFNNTVSLIDESVKEIRTVAHNMIPGSLIKGGLIEAVKDFISKINNSGKFKIELQIHHFNQRLEPTAESILFRVMQEILGNIIKHANATLVTVQIINHEKELIIMIEDNGVGFDVNVMQLNNGMGLKNIQSRIAFLKGKINYDSSPGSGTTVVIEIPMS